LVGVIVRYSDNVLRVSLYTSIVPFLNPRCTYRPLIACLFRRAIIRKVKRGYFLSLTY